MNRTCAFVPLPVLPMARGMLLFLLLLAGCAGRSTHPALEKNVMETQTIKELIERSYLQGALNAMNTHAMLEGYHPDFAIFSSEGNELKKLPLADWITMIRAYKDDPQQRESGLRTMEYEIERIDITGQAACVKVRLFRNGRIIFTDYITLLQFNGTWKIVTKIYHSHVANPWG